MELVKMKDNHAYCDSSMIAKKFGIKHNKVISVCNLLMSDLEAVKGTSYNPLIIKEQREYRGAEFTAYLMDRNFFSLLCMRFRGVKALEWQIKFNDAFYKMESKIIENSKPAVSMIGMNDLVKVIESDKDAASVCGRHLANYKKVKKQHSEELKVMVSKVQLQLGFEG